MRSRKCGARSRSCKKEVLNFSVSRGEILKYKVNSLVAAANSTRNSSVLADSFLNLKYPSLDAPICKPYIDFLERLAPQEAADICARNFDENKSTSALLLPTSKVRRNKRASQAVKQEDEIVELSNGVRLILMPRRNFPKLHLRATALGGAQVLERRLRDIQGLAALSILRDTRRRNAAELADLIESRGISFNSSFGDATASVFVESLPDHWRTSAEILGDSLTCLRIDQKPSRLKGALWRRISLKTWTIFKQQLLSSCEGNFAEGKILFLLIQTEMRLQSGRRRPKTRGKFCRLYLRAANCIVRLRNF